MLPFLTFKTIATKPPTQKRGRGRPKGSKNKDKTAVVLNRELLHIKGMITALFNLIAGALSPTHLVLDGHFGHNTALQMARQKGLHLVSKLRYDSALYLPYHSCITAIVSPNFWECSSRNCWKFSLLSLL